MAPLQTVCCLSVLVIAFVVSTPAPPQAVTDYNEIQKNFRQFQNQLRLKNGDAAARFVSQNSVEQFDQIRLWALNASPDELAQISVTQQIEVLRFRQLFTSPALATMNGRAVIAALIDEGELHIPFVADAILTEPVFQSERCYLHIYDNQGAAKEKLTFVKEKEWRIDIASMEYVQEKVYKSMMKKQELEPAELAQVIISSRRKNVDHLGKPLKRLDD